jgi:hypothetical protein
VCLADLLLPQGLGITLFGMAYMFAHDGLVHRRFPVGPIADVPYFRRVAAAHKVGTPAATIFTLNFLMR